MSALPIRKPTHSERDRADLQIALRPLTQRTSQRGPLAEDPMHLPRINERDASIAGLGDEVRNCWREIRALRKEVAELRERLAAVEEKRA